MKKFLSILMVLVFAFAFSANLTMAAAIADVVYTPTTATVGTSPAASATLTTFTTSTAVAGGHYIVATFPTGTVLNPANIVKGDFTIQETGAGSAATAPVSVTADAGARTLTFIVHPASISTDTAGIGVFTIALSGTAGGNEIVHPTTKTTTGEFSIATEAGDSGADTDVTFVAGNMTHWDVAPAAVTAGAAFTVAITAHDVYNNVTTKQTDGTALGDETLTITSTATAIGGNIPTYNGNDLTDGETVAINFATGTANATNFVFYKATETPTITIASSSVGAVTGTSAAITVATGAKNEVLISSTKPTIGYIYQNLSPQLSAKLIDAYGNTVTSDNASQITYKAYTSADCTTTAANPDLTGTATVAVTAGVATFPGLRYNTVNTTGIYIRAAHDVNGSGTINAATEYDCTNLIKVYSNVAQTVTANPTVATTTTTAPTTTVTTAPATTTTTTAIPTPSKAISSMTVAEKNSYIMELQTFLIQLLTQLLTMIKK